MKTLKKLTLALLFLCTSSTFATTGGGGFDSPMEGFRFFIDLAEKARIYKDKHGYFSKKHINALAPHTWANNKDYIGSAESKLGNHRGFVLNSQDGEHPFIVDIKHTKPFFNYGDKRKGIMTISYSYYKYQQKHPYKREREFQIRAKKIGDKIKWYIYL